MNAIVDKAKAAVAAKTAEVKEDVTDAITKVEEKVVKIFRWNGVGPVHLPTGHFFHWPVRDPVLVTADPKIHKTLADVVDGRLLVEIDPTDTDWEEGILAEVKIALDHYAAKTTPLATASVGSFGKSVAGILNSDTIRATSQRSDAGVASQVPAVHAAPVDLKASLDAIANATL